MSVLVLGISGAFATHDLTFQLDRNATDPAGAAGDDWETLYDGGGSADGFTGILPDIGADGGTQFHGGGSKDDLDITEWLWVDGEPLDKDDITNAYAAAYVNTIDTGANNIGDLIIYFGLDRFSANGSAQVGFWFLQEAVGLTGIAESGGFQFSGQHQVGDVLVQSNFSNGGVIDNVTVYEWVGSGGDQGTLQTLFSAADCVGPPAAGADDPACATVMRADTADKTAPWPYTPKANEGVPGSFLPGGFFEGGINVSRLIPDAACFSTFIAETRTSTPFDARLKDFVLGNFDLCSIDVQKTGDTLSKVGDSVDYTITVTNDGSATLYKDDITDTLLGAIATNGVNNAANPYVTSNTCGASLVAGASCTITATRTVLAGDPDPLPNTVTVHYTGKADLTDTGVSDSDGHSVNLFQPAIDVDKTGDTLSKVGDSVDYVITLSNDSSADTPALTCTATDTLLGTVFGPAVLPLGDTVINRSRTVLAGDADPLVNTVSMSCSPAGFPNVLNDSDGHSVNLFQPAIDVDKTGDTLSKVGDSVDYVITLSNDSSADTPALTCTATDTLLGTVFGPAVLPLGDTVINRSRTVLAGDADPLVNTVSMSCSPAGFPNVLNDSDGHSVNLFQPSITFDKTGDTLSKVGDSVDYTITLTNTSSADTPQLSCSVTDTLLGAIGNANLNPGQTVVFNRTRTVLAADPDPLVNTASATCSPAGFPNVLSASDGHSVNLFQPSITLTKTGPDFTKATDDNDYVITLTNTSSADTPQLSCAVTDTLLGAIGNANLNPGQSAIFNVVRTTLAGDPDPLVNTASAACSPAGFPNVLNASDSHSSDVLHPAFTLTKVCHSSQPVPQEGPAVFRVTFTNTGDADLVVTLDDGIGTVNIAAGGSQSWDVPVAGPFSGQATVSNTVNANISLHARYGLSNTYTASASADCRIGSRVEVEKTVNGLIDSTLNLVFEIYDGPDGFGSTALATDSTLGDADGVLDFGLLNLDPLETYTVCELNLPAGWTSVWSVNAVDVTALVYNPDADNPIPEDLGNRCIDFGAGTTIPLTAGGTLRFVVDNQVPQGDARTPGYWKNWNTCTGGRQAENAAKNGGSAAGFWLLDDLLPQTIGVLEITDCETGVLVLDSRDIDTGKKMSSDAAYTLARALLAAQLNFGAGAGTCSAATTAAADAQALLVSIGFDGSGNYLGPKVKNGLAILRAEALELAGILDDYNNNLIC